MDQLEPNLVGMYIRRFSKTFYFFVCVFIGSTQKKQEVQRCQKGCRLFLIVFSKGTVPIGTTRGRNALKSFLCVYQKYTKETRGSKMSKTVLYVFNLLF